MKSGEILLIQSSVRRKSKPKTFATIIICLDKLGVFHEVIYPTCTYRCKLSSFKNAAIAAYEYIAQSYDPPIKASWRLRVPSDKEKEFLQFGVSEAADNNFYRETRSHYLFEHKMNRFYRVPTVGEVIDLWKLQLLPMMHNVKVSKVHARSHKVFRSHIEEFEEAMESMKEDILIESFLYKKGIVDKEDKLEESFDKSAEIINGKRVGGYNFE